MDVNDWYVSVVVFFKQKTAYEMRISDWSSDVCSSDLAKSSRVTSNSSFKQNLLRYAKSHGRKSLSWLRLHYASRLDSGAIRIADTCCTAHSCSSAIRTGTVRSHSPRRISRGPGWCSSEIGRASWREGGCQYVLISGVGGSLKK